MPEFPCPSLHHGTFPRHQVGAIVKLISFVSNLSGITVLFCIISNILRSSFICFDSKFFKRDGKFSLYYSFLFKRKIIVFINFTLFKEFLDNFLLLISNLNFYGHRTYFTWLKPFKFVEFCFITDKYVISWQTLHVSLKTMFILLLLGEVVSFLYIS